MSASISISVNRPRREPLRLSPLLRFSLATADPTGKPVLLPLSIPKTCAGRGFRCHNIVCWRANDGRNAVNLCKICGEKFLKEHNGIDYELERL